MFMDGSPSCAESTRCSPVMFGILSEVFQVESYYEPPVLKMPRWLSPAVSSWRIMWGSAVTAPAARVKDATKSNIVSVSAAFTALSVGPT